MNFVFLDSSKNFPYNYTADNTKISFMSKGLIKAGHKANILNSRSGYGSTRNEDFSEGIKYVVYKKGGLLQYLRNIGEQIKDLKTVREENDNYIIITSTFFPLFLFDIIVCKLLGYKVLFLFHELRSSLRSTRNIFDVLDRWLQDNIVGYLVDAILPISHYLWDFSEKFKKPMFMVPILADFKSLTPVPKQNHFAYCGNIGFLDAINIIIDSFKRFDSESISLKLILYGNQAKIDELKNKTRGMNIKILQKVPADDLLKIYQSAIGLFLPLNTSEIQDKFRFSQKVAEYISTSTPIITVNYGEIPYYFKDRENAIVVDSFDSKKLTDAMTYLIENPDEAQLIGSKGFDTGVRCFSNNTNMKELCSFIKTFK